MEVPRDAFLVTMDVPALYTNIPHADGIESLVWTYNSYREDDLPHGSVLTALAGFVLKLNGFEFDKNFFIQTSGTAMGTKMAPNYGNIFMGNLESNFLSSYPLQPMFYKRYIHDIFIIWPHKEVIKAFNSDDPSINFTHNYSKTEVHFLDVRVIIEGRKLVTELYRKPTYRPKYLHFDRGSHI